MRSPSAWWSLLLGSAELYWALPLLPPAVRQKPMPNEVLRCTCNMLHSSCYCFCEQLPKDQRQFFACVTALSVLCPPPWRAQNDTRCSKIRMKADFGILNSIQTWSTIQIQEAVAWLLTQVCNVRDPKLGIEPLLSVATTTVGVPTKAVQMVLALARESVALHAPPSRKQTGHRLAAFSQNWQNSVSQYFDKSRYVKTVKLNRISLIAQPAKKIFWVVFAKGIQGPGISASICLLKFFIGSSSCQQAWSRVKRLLPCSRTNRSDSGTRGSSCCKQRTTAQTVPCNKEP